jgi:hypothetical protein
MGSGARLLVPSAAYVNAFLVHSLEFDCIHEAAVVHSIATLLSTLFAWSERASKRGAPVDGRRFLTAMSVGVDVAGFLGAATKSGLPALFSGLLWPADSGQPQALRASRLRRAAREGRAWPSVRAVIRHHAGPCSRNGGAWIGRSASMIAQR